MESVRAWFARRGLVRPARGRMLAGVNAGLARRFGVSPTVVRLLFAVSVLLPGPQFVLYLGLWLAMPVEGRLEAGAPPPALDA